MSTIKERLNDYISYLGVSDRNFEIKCGLSNGYLNNVKSIGSDKLHAMHVAYPTLSISWLLFEEGEMLLEGGKVNEPTSANLYERLLREKDARIKVQEDTIADLRERIAELKGDIATPQRSVHVG